MPQRLICLFAIVFTSLPGTARGDQSLVLHYTFDQDDGETVNDQSEYGNNGKMENGEHFAEQDGKNGVMRFNGNDAELKLSRHESLKLHGDTSFEMWVRLNDTKRRRHSGIFSDDISHGFIFQVAGYQTLGMLYKSQVEPFGLEQMVIPTKRDILSTEWSHIAVVMEYPRCRIYHNGKLVTDGYMPIPAMWSFGNRAKQIGRKSPIDLDEFRLYNRALTSAEVAAHFNGQELEHSQQVELAVEAHWYKRELTLRASGKGVNWEDHTAKMTLQDSAGRAVAPTKTAAFTTNNGRYIASVVYPLDDLAGKVVDGVCHVVDGDGNVVKQVYGHKSLIKPDWVYTREGYSDTVLKPWTPVRTSSKTNGGVEFEVYGRRYVFASGPFPVQIETGGKPLLAGPIQLRGSPATWKPSGNRVTEQSDTQAAITQTLAGDGVTLTVNTTIEFDGYMTFDCVLEANRDMTIDRLALNIPMHTDHAGLAYGNRVKPENRKIPIDAWYSGAVRGDLDFLFSGHVWLGDVERGLVWQSESDEHWRNADRQKAIQILPRGETTTFKANFIDTARQLKRGDKLHYKFALQATPIKPVQRDAWDLRLVRYEPWGRSLEMHKRKAGDRPVIEYLKERGVRHIWIRTADVWPWPMPVHEPYARALAATIDYVHSHGLKIYPYLIHQRFPVHVPESDIHGLHMAKRPTRWYIQAGPPTWHHPRPGPILLEYGADSQGCLFMCAKSMALQDAYIHSLAQRIDQFGDDGVYLDGTAAIVPCYNLEHGCGYMDEDGKLRSTHPAFAVRRFIKRIATVIKSRKPDAVIDVHASFGQNWPALAYGDVLWTGEHWWHLRHKPLKHVASELKLDHFETEFTGRQSGVAVETLSYRLGSRRQVSATSLLYDVPVRVNTAFENPGDNKHFEDMADAWTMRDEFGADDAQKIYHWENQHLVTVANDECYALLLLHPTNGALAFITNRTAGAQDVAVQFNLTNLKLAGKPLELINALTKEPIDMSADGKVTIPLQSEHWIYVWLRPAGQ